MFKNTAPETIFDLPLVKKNETFGILFNIDNFVSIIL